MSNAPEQPQVYGPVEPRPLDVLADQQAQAAGLVEAAAAEHDSLNKLPSSEQAQLAGHIALVKQDLETAQQMEADINQEAVVRTNIDQNRADQKAKRLAEIRAGLEEQRDRDANDPIITDASGNRVRLSEQAAITAASGAKDSGNRY